MMDHSAFVSNIVSVLDIHFVHRTQRDRDKFGVASKLLISSTDYTLRLFHDWIFYGNTAILYYHKNLQFSEIDDKMRLSRQKIILDVIM